MNEGLLSGSSIGVDFPIRVFRWEHKQERYVGLFIKPGVSALLPEAAFPLSPHCCHSQLLLSKVAHPGTSKPLEWHSERESVAVGQEDQCSKGRVSRAEPFPCQAHC